MTSTQAEHPAAEVLRVLAVSRSCGALEIRGTPSGTIFMHEGEITYAEVLGIPLVPEPAADDSRLQSTIREFIVEAGLTLLTGPNPDGERPLFRLGRRHWTGLTCRLGVDSLLIEVAQQLAGFAGLGVNPDDEVELCGLTPGRTTVLSRQQWALAARLSGGAEMPGPQTARAFAWRAGAALSVTIVNLASLITAGVARLVSPGPNRAAPFAAPLEVGLSAGEPLAGESLAGDSLAAGSRSSGSPGPPSIRLTQRVRGATSPPAVAPDDHRGTNSESEAASEGRQALALRLLEGLRRL